eukprot:4321909-Prymnesium_polylepis.3
MPPAWSWQDQEMADTLLPSELTSVRVSPAAASPYESYCEATTVNGVLKNARRWWPMRQRHSRATVPAAVPAHGSLPVCAARQSGPSQGASRRPGRDARVNPESRICCCDWRRRCQASSAQSLDAPWLHGRRRRSRQR